MKGIAPLDIICTVLIILLVLRCALRGFVGEFMAMASVVLGLLGAFFFYKNGAVFIRERFLPELKLIPGILAFVLIFLVIYALVRLVEYILRDIIERIQLGKVDRFLGVFFGLAEGIVLTGLVLFVISVQPLFDPDPVLNGSLFARLLLPLIRGGEYPWAAVL
jgi:membrane protein required for colicin V production